MDWYSTAVASRCRTESGFLKCVTLTTASPKYPSGYVDYHLIRRIPSGSRISKKPSAVTLTRTPSEVSLRDTDGL
jgi:hypothetical protein